MAQASDLVERLRDQGRDAFAKHYSLGMFKLCDEAATEIDRLRKALEDIWDIVHTPTSDTAHRSSRSHFQADFDNIRKIISGSRIAVGTVHD